MCEILFISSGFLVGYNHYKRNIPCDYETSFRYLYKHLRNFYPLELILIICDYISNYKIENNIITEIEIFLSNILMIKVWSRHRKIAFSINAISWFLSVLVLISINILLFFGPNIFTRYSKNKNINNIIYDNFFYSLFNR